MTHSLSQYMHRMLQKKVHVKSRAERIFPLLLEYSSMGRLRFGSAIVRRTLTTRAKKQTTDKIHPVHDEISIETRYTRINPIEHILLRPGMYVGPTERSPPTPTWVLERNNASSTSTQLFSMTRRNTSYIPALLKIFDEILVNASDNAVRKSPHPTTRIDVLLHGGYHSMNEINFQLSQQLPSPYQNQPYVSIKNNGTGIPVVVHRKEGIYIPELLFGHLLTGSNFDDGDDSAGRFVKGKRMKKRITGGRHGYGAKLANIFSKWFEVETLDVERGKLYRQVWENNMSIKHEPVIIDVGTDMSSAVEEGGYTKVSFIPDMKQLWRNYIQEEEGNSELDCSARPKSVLISQDDLDIMSKRAYDIAACSRGNVTVTLNEEVVPIQSFKDYVKMYRSGSTAHPVIFDEVNSDWDIGIGLSTSGSFEQVSFVNGMATTRGGSHIDVIVEKVARHIIQEVTKVHPNIAPSLSPALVKRCLAVFVNSFVENPSFDSQMKESLTSSPDSFGTNYQLSESFLREIIKEQAPSNSIDEDNNYSTLGGPGIVEELVRIARGRLQSMAKRSRRSSLYLPKLDDAHLAGTDQGHRCTLILTEGDSAKAFAIAGLEKIGRDLFGVFPLRGKFLNVRMQSAETLSKNAEVNALFSIIGLDIDCKYETKSERSRLRYGHVMLMTDQDTDGFHIKGLTINFFRHFWPCLLKPAIDDVEGSPFLSSFVTPLLKARSSKRNSIQFFSASDYNNWRASLPNDELKKWTIKYYKGLGTSTSNEAQEYFSDFAKHHRLFRWESEEDGKYIDLVFDKSRSNDRKEWMSNRWNRLPSSTSTGGTEHSITYGTFINTEMIEFSTADNVRSLPSVVDGLKPSQRKVLYACFKRKLKNEVKVAQLSGYCAEHTSYHHGEASLQATIIGMAQDFVGATNINLLHPSGQFGTRLAGGDDAASPRYIFTYLSPLSRLIFPEVDDDILEYLEEDGQRIEPKCYYPIIPLLLCNGCKGIGTGWSSYIPPHNPRDILEFVRARLDDRPKPEINAWVKGFKGDITFIDDRAAYLTTGLCNRISDKSVLINELPVGTWTNHYKTYLYELQEEGKIIDFRENHTSSTVAFTVNIKSAELDRIIQNEGLVKFFKLESYLSLKNMHAFDPSGKITKYDSAEDILDAYFPQRLQLYQKRKLMIEKDCEYQSTMLKNKARFIEMFVEGKINLSRGNTSKVDTVSFLKDAGYTSKNDLEKIRFLHTVEGSNSLLVTTDDVELEDEKGYSDFDYLLNLPLASLTSDRINYLYSEVSKAEDSWNIIRNSSAEDLWRRDLDRLSPYL